LRGVVSGIHLLPFYPWSSDDGFSVKDFLAVDPAVGTWEDVAPLAADFDLMFDAVFNHMSAESAWFQAYLRDEPGFRDFFVSVKGNQDLSAVIRPRALPLLTEFQSASGPRMVWTTFSADQVDLNVRNPEVLFALVEAMLFYVQRGASYLRLDAIAFLCKEVGTACLHLPETHAVIQLFRAVLDQAAPAVRLVTETNVPHLDNISYFGDGSNEAQLVYNFALPPLVLHSFVKGNARALSNWARDLRAPTPETAFFNFLASHDGIGLNPVRGILKDPEIEELVSRATEHRGFVSYKSLPDGSQAPYELNINYLDALSAPQAGEPDSMAARRFLTAQSVMLCLQGVPGIYFHSLFGSRGDRGGAESSQIKRRVNREKFTRERLERELRDKTSLRNLVFGGFSELLRLRKEHAAFSPFAKQTVIEAGDQVFALVRETGDGSDRVLCVHNFAAEPVQVEAGGYNGGELWLEPFEHRWLVLA
jgi:sucrose phosphorylase